MTDEDRPIDRKSNALGPVAQKYEMNTGISTAWMGFSLNNEHHDAFNEAWDVLVTREEWRSWQTDYLHYRDAFLYLCLRDNLDQRRLRKTKQGVSYQFPANDVYDASDEGYAARLFAEIIWTIYDKWASINDFPPPPALPEVGRDKGWYEFKQSDAGENA